MESIKDIINSIVLNPDLAPLLTIIKSARNGAVYGAKVRFPHALVMVFLFRSGTFREKIYLILKATRQHARNLASFAVIYKSSMLLLRALNPLRPGKEGPYDTFLAGLLGGYTVFGRGKQGSVNQQIVIYIFARVMLALAKLSIQPRRTRSSSSPTFSLTHPFLSRSAREKIQTGAWPVFASLSWALVMYIFRWYPDTIQPSLRSSMKYM
ncbi:hypothetical protein EPUS_00854 [Endocarpon pusillum Z07020]|uniref:Peroxisomal membrane protein 4 n=1 Tax=Endocarpon pusillum (strain Z07020 / HMAS-L-300199) TaxID=1263415 RepID=U1GNU4_ENDPU|nr:uncharacterized protein EPUS_00854 [Endocarpon pusillum Z07020]ERF73601.1 hypothetical protein EPUS_00854 [Endocarpon pusillum Z07020]